MILFENFNTSNQTSPRFERHDNFVIELKPPGCAVVQTLDYEDRCDFVKETEECREDIVLFDYTNLFYCRIDAQNAFEQGLAIGLFFVLIIYIFGFVGATTEKFFCPPLKIITKSLGISENLAGITVLAFGNSAPDLISDLSDVSREWRTMYSDSMGSAIFITACVAGIIIVIAPLKMEGTAFIRDIAFHILAVSFIDYAIKSDRKVTVFESSVMLSIYFVYFIVIIVDQVLLEITLKRLKRQIQRQNSMTEAQSIRLRELEEEAGIELVIKPKPISKDNATKAMEYKGKTANEKLFSQFKESILPIEEWREEWQKRGCFGRFVLSFLGPIEFIISIFVPCVDVDLEIDGWSKLLNCLQLVVTPAVFTWIIGGNTKLYGYVLPMFTFFITVPLAITIFLGTRTDRAPKFHIVFAVFAMLASTILIRIISLELINIIDVLGIVLYCSGSFLACTVLAWGDCCGDLIASIELARQGYQKMGLAACIAGPLFYLSLALGVTYLYECLQVEERSFEATQGSMGENCTVFTLANLTGLLIAGITTNFHIRRSIGVNLLIIYSLFCLYSFLGEIQFIHSFGNDHTEDYGIAYI